MKFHTKLIAALFLVPLASLNAADLKLAAVLSDHMVLQRDKPVPVWGWADAGEAITVEFAGQKKSAIADASGKWQVKLDPMKASSESRVMIVQSAKPDRKLEVTDVLVGEVWLGSGQSNMAMRVSGARDYKTEQTTANLPQIRTFNEGSNASARANADCSGKWSVCSPESVGTFSATLYFFGRELHRELNVPVGLINSSVGGTPIEQWIAAEAQKGQGKAPPAPKSSPKGSPQKQAANQGAAAAKKNIIGGPVEGKICLMFDDMISTGGSICGAAKLVHEAGAKEIHLAATHGVLCGAAIENLKNAPIDSLVITNTIPLPPEKRLDNIHVLTVAPLLAEAIRRIHSNRSISQMFSSGPDDS